MRFCSITRVNKRIFTAVFIAALQFTSIQLRAQSESLSPYSRYGIGDVAYKGFARNIGMGGIGLGDRSIFEINVVNPASYSALLLTEFDIAAEATFSKLSTASLSQKKSGATFSYFALGFPVVNKKWGAAFGLIPYSSVGYKVSSSVTDPSPANVSYEGTGGVNRFFIGNAFTIKKNLSAGFNASYLFGSIDRISTIEYTEPNFFNSRYTTNTIIRDFYFDYGLQYVFDSLNFAKSDSLKEFDKMKKNLTDSVKVLTKQIDSLSGSKDREVTNVKQQIEELQKNVLELNSRMLQVDSARKNVKTRRQKSDWSLTTGLTFATPFNVSASQDQLTELYQGSGNFIIVRDTVLMKEGDKGNIKLPLTVGFGIAFKKGSKWLIGADASIQNWQDYSYFGLKDSLHNSLKLATGFQFTPDDRGIKSYWQMVQYRFGAFYNKTYLQLRSTQLNEYGLTAGLGLPVMARKGKRFSFSTVHLSAALGTRGTTDNSLIKEDFVRVSIGVTFNDRWFIKPKFD